MAYSDSKTVSWTPKGDVAKQLKDYCRQTKGIDDGQFHSMKFNPQDVVRNALLASNVISKKQFNCGDTSLWDIGDAVKTTLWRENHADLTNFAKEQGLNKQQIINECVMDYINSLS